MCVEEVVSFVYGVCDVDGWVCGVCAPCPRAQLRCVCIEIEIEIGGVCGEGTGPHARWGSCPHRSLFSIVGGVSWRGGPGYSPLQH